MKLSWGHLSAQSSATTKLKNALCHCTLKGNEISWSNWPWLRSAVTHLHIVCSAHFATAPGCTGDPLAHVFNGQATFSKNSQSLGAKWFLSSPVLQWPHYWLVTVLEQTARLSRPVVNLSARLPWIECVCRFIVSSSAGMTPSMVSGGNMSSLFFIKSAKYE